MKLILIRHGETEDNKAKIIQGHKQGKLSVDGIVQAKKVAKRLKDERIDFIYSSDLARAADTAKAIAKNHDNTPIKFVTELRERFLGDWEGKTYNLEKDEKIRAEYNKTIEINKDLFIRAEKFLHKILAKHPQDTILFVGHNGINRAIIGTITGKSPQEMKSIEVLHNTSISIYEIDEDKNHKIHLFNCIEHLE